MRTSLLLGAPLAALLVTTSGCAETPFHPHTAHRGLGRTIALAADIAALAASADAAQSQADAPDDEAGGEGPSYPGYIGIPPHEPAAEADYRLDYDPPRFDLAAAHGALDGVDVAACKTDGLAAGYGRVVVGFGGDGAPAGVAVELPAGSRPAARACVEGAFRQAHVAPFDGAVVNVRRTFFVQA